MPLYRYRCSCGSRWEQRAGYDDGVMPCRCGKSARRESVYPEQYIHAETGPKGGNKNPVPRDEKSYRKEFSEFREASAEIDYTYTKAEQEGKPVKRPNYYKEGLRRAKQKNAKVNA